MISIYECEIVGYVCTVLHLAEFVESEFELVRQFQPLPSHVSQSLRHNSSALLVVRMLLYISKSFRILRPGSKKRIA